MTADPPRSPRLSRRRLLGLPALALLPGGCAGRLPDPGPAATAGSAAPSGRPTTAAPAARPRATGASPVVSGGGPVPNRPGKVLFGAYLSLRGHSLSESLALRRRQLDRDHRVVHRFYAWADPLPDAFPEIGDRTLLLSWRGTRYDEINGGSADRRIAKAARALARYGEPMLLRWGWEMNGDWYPWGGADNDRDAAGYVAAWHRLHRIFEQEGADNVAWVWSPNWNSTPHEPWNDHRAYYPGDRYVDWVGVSGYNLRRETPETLFRGIHDAYAPRKPIMIAETGAVDRGGRTKADWITALAGWVGDHPAVGAVVWFDTDTHPGSPEKWRIDTDAEALAAYRRMARHPDFQD